MRKVLKFGLIVPLVMLLAFGVSLAEGTEDLKDKSLDAKSLDSSENGRDRSDDAETTSADSDRGEAAVLDGTLRGIDSRRGRQDRKGQATPVEAELWKWNDSNSGKSDDETPDEDEDPDMTPPGA